MDIKQEIIKLINCIELELIERGFSISYQPYSPKKITVNDEYEIWIGQYSKDNFIITLSNENLIIFKLINSFN